MSQSDYMKLYGPQDPVLAIQVEKDFCPTFMPSLLADGLASGLVSALCDNRLIPEIVRSSFVIHGSSIRLSVSRPQVKDESDRIDVLVTSHLHVEGAAFGFYASPLGLYVTLVEFNGDSAHWCSSQLIPNTERHPLNCLLLALLPQICEAFRDGLPDERKLACVRTCAASFSNLRKP